MSRRTNAAARLEPRSLPEPARSRRIRTTLGELVAAAWEAAGPDASPEDVERLLRRVARMAAARPGIAFD